ncbi:MAG: NAD-dependent epimerase/dehydratase family protein [Clostridia bacterium]|nr:NAD-dependent epimerase/dehydratase family protein [Clostridia bacterium]
MKRILICGAGSFIGDSFAAYLQNDDAFSVDILDMQNEAWREKDFSGYDAVFHVAGIAHRKETAENRDLYFKVNRDLCIETARHAKNCGVGQFVFLSSMSVYGLLEGHIDKDTQPSPTSAYGKSKLEAEKMLETLCDASFRVAVLRPPMVYGEGCKGNYPLLAALAKKTPAFPDIKNARSMISIENLCKAVKQVLDTNGSGLFFPQDPEYVCTTEMVRGLAKKYGRKIWFTRLFNPIIKRLPFSVRKKLFGSLTYDKSLSEEFLKTENAV